MEPNNLMLSQDAFNAYMLRGVMGATGQPGETTQDAQTRWAAIVEIFRTFEAANPMEAMIACHCISLRFMLDAAMRDAGAPDLDPAMAIRLRASVLAVGKSLHLWMTEFASLHARNEARAVEVGQSTGQPDAAVTSAKSQLAPPRLPSDQAERTRPIAAQPVKATPPFVAAASGADRSGSADLTAPSMPVRTMKASLLSSVAASLGVASNGRMIAATSPSGR
jgi:hypothetical protein